MTAKDRETEEDHLSNNINSTGQVGATQSEPNLTLASSTVVRERGRSWGGLLSGIICLNILILGCALVSASTFNNAIFGSAELQIFLIILILLTTIWMLYYAIYMSVKDQAVTYKDGHAGPIWLRGKDSFLMASYVFLYYPLFYISSSPCFFFSFPQEDLCSLDS